MGEGESWLLWEIKIDFTRKTGILHHFQISMRRMSCRQSLLTWGERLE
jgi:hypothetical protein